MASSAPSSAPVVNAPAEDLVLVGNPNVGKSVLFGWFTGTYVTVSNYPGTTVEIARGLEEIRDHQMVERIAVERDAREGVEIEHDFRHSPSAAESARPSPRPPD